ncbi:MAG: cob(I)yrinic acid a,c-diamide adenosyltransferase, partial [Thermoplasmata archaeon]
MRGGIGRIIVYTGNGQGKTTASLGIALRSIAHNKKVVVIQFM